MGQVTHIFERGHLVADGGGANVQPVRLHERLGPNGHPPLDVGADNQAKHGLSPWGHLRVHLRVLTRAALALV